MTQSAFLYLDHFIEAKNPIYVRNISTQRGIVVLTLNDNGRTMREAIPATRYPVCLSNKATPDMIRNSSSLRQFLDAGALELVDHKQAEKELMEPGARAALQAAYESIGYKNREVRGMRGGATDIADAGEDDEEVPVHRQLDAAVAGNIPAPFAHDFSDVIEDEEPDDPGAPQVRVQYLVEALASKDMKSRQVKAELMGLDLTPSDLAFVIAKTTGIVQKYAKEELAKFQDGSSVESGGLIESVG